MNTGREPGGSDGPHVFVTDLTSPVLGDADERHLRRSLRLRDGDPLTVSDGEGRWRRCRLGPTVAVEGDIVDVPAPEQPLTVAISLTKGAKPELAVQKLTELGVDRVLLFSSARSVPIWDDAKRSKQTERLSRVAREAGMQCRRVRLPSVEVVADLVTVAALPGAHMADRGAPAYAGQHTVLVGPEGGWSDDERGTMPAVGLGPHVLRAETAAIAAATLMAAHHRLR